MSNLKLSAQGNRIMLDVPKYDMSHARRGKAIIFNHYNEGEGSKFDVNNLETTLGMNYGFELVVHDNLTYSQLYDTLIEASEDDYTDCDCLFIAVLTHGNEQCLKSQDRNYRPDELWTPFTLCQTLVGKPKIFLIHACRGTNSDGGIELRTDSNPRINLLPHTADLLIIYSSFQGYVSYLTDMGSPFIDVFCNELRRAAPYEFDFCHLLTIVINIMAYQCGVIKEGLKKQMPTYNSTLTKLMYITPKNT